VKESYRVESDDWIPSCFSGKGRFPSCHNYSFLTPLIGPDFCALHSSDGVQYVLDSTCLTVPDLEDEPATCGENGGLCDESGDIQEKGETAGVRCPRWITQEGRGILEGSDGFVQIGILASRDVGWVSRDEVKRWANGELLDEFRGITDIGVQGDEDVLRSSGRWSRGSEADVLMSQMDNGIMRQCVVFGKLQCFQGRVNPDNGSRPGDPTRAEEKRDTAGPRAEIEHVNGLLPSGRDGLGEAQSPVLRLGTWNQDGGSSEHVEVAEWLGAF
jgi:hypothetical protein